MVYTVPYSNLDSWLQAQPENTVDTPYEIEVTGLTVYDFRSSQDNIIKTSLGKNPLKYVDLRNTTIPNGVTSLEKAFYGCKTLVYSPVLPEGLTTLLFAFSGCSSLKESPVIPDSILSLSACFENCISLIYPPIIPSGCRAVASLFRGCTSLVEAPVFPEGTTISLERTFEGCTSLINSPNIPNSVTNMTGTFKGCTSLKTTPTISSNVTNMEACFFQCENIIEAPVIPSGVTNFRFCFYLCTSLIKAPIIPNTVKNMEEAFTGCRSLTNPPIIPNGVTNMNLTFAQCRTLAYKPIIPSSVTKSQGCYDQVTQTKWGGSASQIDTFAPAQTEEFVAVEVVADTENNCYEMTDREVYGVSISNLSTWLSEHDANAVDTPYEINVVEMTANDCNIRTALTNNSTKFVDLRYTTLPELTSLTSFFKNCVSLVLPPSIPNTVTSFFECFKNCSNLKEAPVIPSNAVSLNDTFENCTSLVTAPNIPNGVTNMTETFKGCTSLVNVSTIPDSVTNMMNTFENCTSLVISPALSNGITSLTETFNGCTSLTTAPSIPANVTSMVRAFCNCISLVSAPTLPNGVTSIGYCFSNCNFTVAPAIPNSVVYMNGAFENCSKITEIYLIPSGVTQASNAFKGCASLRKINNFEVPLATIKNNPNFQNMFQGCVSLTQIGYKVNESDWHVWRLRFGANTVEGKVYDPNGNAVNIPQTSITKSSLKLPIKTDELWFPDMTDPDFDTDAKIDALIEKVIQFRYTYHINAVIEPDKKTFVLQADDPDNFITNLPIIPQQAVDRVESGNMNPVTSNAVYNFAKPVDSVTSGNMQSVTSNAVFNACSPNYAQKQLIFDGLTHYQNNDYVVPDNGFLVASGWGTRQSNSYIIFVVNGIWTQNQGNADEAICNLIPVRKGDVVEINVYLASYNRGVYFVPCV